MASTRVLTGLVIVAALAAAPVSADQGRRRAESDRGRERNAEQSDRGRERAIPRAREAERQSDRRQQPVQRRDDRQYQAQRQYEARRQYEVDRRREAERRYDTRRDGRPYYSNRDYGRSRIAPRIIRPTIVTVIPYRPYVYRPRLGIGVYYGAGGSYPYGYTPRGYYNPIPGRPYGGLRITGAPREAHVFADGYYVGIVNDFDGIFQHLNLEAGPHRIEIEVPGYETIAFDVMVQPGRTVTFRADLY
jgi:PEGA domain-containing protein